MRRPLVIGNWKMHGSLTMLEKYTADFLDLDNHIHDLSQNIDIVLCPPFVYLQALSKKLKKTYVMLGAQTVHSSYFGAHTGEISAPMLLDLNCKYVIIGHSERRQEIRESDDLICEKVLAVYKGGLIPILCVGETKVQRVENKTFDVIRSQCKAVLSECNALRTFSSLIIAYEPVWAIGTGLSATAKQAQAVHVFIREIIKDLAKEQASAIRIVYGGSVKPKNAAELFKMPDIDGALIGGGSLVADDFFAICKAAGV